MKMDGRDRAEYQNWEKNDINVILEKFKLVKDKTCIVCLLHLTKEEKMWKSKRGEPVDRNLSFSERESLPSL